MLQQYRQLNLARARAQSLQFYHVTTSSYIELLQEDFQTLHTLFLEENQKYLDALQTHKSKPEVEAIQQRVQQLFEALKRKREAERSKKYLGFLYLL